MVDIFWLVVDGSGYIWLVAGGGGDCLNLDLDLDLNG